MFGLNKRERKLRELPAIMTADNPVNYDSVLDYLVGLGGREYDKLLKVATIYREANKDAAKVLGVKDQPTTQLKDEKPTEDEIDKGLDDMLNSDDLDYLEDDVPPAPEPKKEQSPSKETKVTVNRQ